MAIRLPVYPAREGSSARERDVSERDLEIPDADAAVCDAASRRTGCPEDDDIVRAGIHW